LDNTHKSLAELRNEVVIGIKDVVGRFRQGEDEEGFLSLAALINPLQDLISLTADCGKVETVVSLNDHLLLAIEAMEQGDPVLLADHLEYGVLPRVIGA